MQNVQRNKPLAKLIWKIILKSKMMKDHTFVSFSYFLFLFSFFSLIFSCSFLHHERDLQTGIYNTGLSKQRLAISFAFSFSLNSEGSIRKKTLKWVCLWNLLQLQITIVYCKNSKDHLRLNFLSVLDVL